MTSDPDRSGMGSESEEDREEDYAQALHAFAAAAAGGFPSGGVAPQKWVQCASCDKWRKVPYDVNDEDIPEDWTCDNNVWDEDHKSCSVPQALSDKQIDEILALQEAPAGAGGLARIQAEHVDADDEGQGGPLSRAGRVGPRSGGAATSRHPPSGLSRTASGKVMAPSPRNRPSNTAAIPKGGVSAKVPSVKGGSKPAAVTKAVPHNGGNHKLARSGSGKIGGKPITGVGKSGGGAVKGGGSGAKRASGGGHKKKGGHVGMEEAAVALLHIGGSVGEEEEEEEEAGQQWPRASVRPGKVVWAKVEGHEWWPAKVVRRRAVPREVGPPPTIDGVPAPATYIPVVFFTPEGIPGEAEGESMDEDEAEYAWLTPDLVKPFWSEEGGNVSADPGLKASVSAAEAAIEEEKRIRGDDTDGEDMSGESDSDGGWGATPGAAETRKDGKSGNKGSQRSARSKGGSKARNVRGGREEAAIEEEVTGSASPALWEEQRPHTVESILGWRPPMAGGNIKKKKSDDDDMEGVSQDEQGAVAALLAAAGVEEEEQGGGLSSAVPREPEFCVKWAGRPHCHVEWLPESVVATLSRRKLINFKRKHGAAPCNLVRPEWQVPERFVARRPAPTGPGWEVLIKWRGLGHDAATWEPEGEGITAAKEHGHLMDALWRRQRIAAHRATPEALATEQELRPLDVEQLPELAKQPEWVRSDETLHPHQLDAVNWMRRNWVAGRCGILADEPGLGRTATVAIFLKGVMDEYQLSRPSLVVAPQTSIDFWEGEISFWTGDADGVVTYVGAAAARSVIAEHELWLLPSSMDGKTAPASPLRHKVPKPLIVLTSYETMASDSEVLGALAWETVVLDDRNSSRVSHARMYSAMGDLAARFRLMLSAGPPRGAPADMFNALRCLQPSTFHSSKDVADGFEGWEEQQQVEVLSQLLEASSLSRRRSAVVPKRGATPSVSVALLVPSTPRQAAMHRELLIRSFQMLTDAETGRQSSHRYDQLRALCEDLIEVLSYPELAEQEDDPAVSLRGIDVSASGKLELLDRLLPLLREQGQQVLLLTHRPRILRMLEVYVASRLNEEEVAVIHHEVPTAQRAAAFAELSRPGCRQWLVLHEARCLGIGTNLPNVSRVVVFDSEFSPAADLASLGRPLRLGPSTSEGAAAPLQMYRIVAAPVEERLLELQGAAGQAAEGILRPAPGKSVSVASELLEDVVRTGAARLFQQGGKGAEGATPHFPGELLAEVVEACGRGEAQAEGLGGSMVRRWVAGDPARADAAVGPWDEHHTPQLEVVSPFAGGAVEGLHRFDQTLRETATFWDSLLRDSWEKLLAEEGRRSGQHGVEAAEDADGDSVMAEGSLPDSPGGGGTGGGQDEGAAGASGKAGTARRRAGKEEGPKKRRRRDGKAATKSTTNAVESEREDLVRELVRQDMVRTWISEAGSVEARIVGRAGARLAEVCAETGLEEEAVQQLVTMAKEAAEVLLLLHHDGQTLSDFQDYTLVAITAVAAHLCRITLPGGDRGVAVLAARYGHDVAALDQVYDHILDCLRHYRAFHDRRSQFAAEDPAGMEAAVVAETERQQREAAARPAADHSTGAAAAAMGEGVGAGTGPPAVSDPAAAAAAAANAVGVPGLAGDALIEASAEFLGKLNGVVQENWQICAAVLQSTATLDTVAKNPPSMEVMSTWQWTKIGEQIQEHVDYLNQSHEAKVKRIDEEYHSFMEKVRERALAAIDKAKGHYSTAFDFMAARRQQYCNLYNRFQEASQQAAAASGAPLAVGLPPGSGVPGLPPGLGAVGRPAMMAGPSLPPPQTRLSKAETDTSGAAAATASNAEGAERLSGALSAAPPAAALAAHPHLPEGLLHHQQQHQAAVLQQAQLQMLLAQQQALLQQQHAAAAQQQAHQQHAQQQQHLAVAAAAAAAATAAASSSQSPAATKGAGWVKAEEGEERAGNAQQQQQQQQQPVPAVPRFHQLPSGPSLPTHTQQPAGRGNGASAATPAARAEGGGLPSFQRLSHQQVQQVLQTLKATPPAPRSPRTLPARVATVPAPPPPPSSVPQRSSTPERTAPPAPIPTDTPRAAKVAAAAANAAAAQQRAPLSLPPSTLPPSSDAEQPRPPPLPSPTTVATSAPEPASSAPPQSTAAQPTSAPNHSGTASDSGGVQPKTAPSSSALPVEESGIGSDSPAKPPRPPGSPSRQSAPPNAPSGSSPSKVPVRQGSPSGGSGLISRVSSLTQWLGSSGGVPSPVKGPATNALPQSVLPPSGQQQQRSSPEAMKVDTPPSKLPPNTEREGPPPTEAPQKR